MPLTKTDIQVDRFQAALSYLVEYNGVNGAMILDSEGLVIEHLNKDGVDAEQFSPLALLILDQTSRVLGRMNEPVVQSMVVKNQNSWITFERIDDLILMVRANLTTDDLLKVRIGQAVDMIKQYLKERYPLLAR